MPLNETFGEVSLSPVLSLLLSAFICSRPGFRELFNKQEFVLKSEQVFTFPVRDNNYVSDYILFLLPVCFAYLFSPLRQVTLKVDIFQ